MDLSGQHDWSEYTLYWAEACVDEGHTVMCHLHRHFLEIPIRMLHINEHRMRHNDGAAPSSRPAPLGSPPPATRCTARADGSTTALPEHSSTVSSDEGGAAIAAGCSALRRIAT